MIHSSDHSPHHAQRAPSLLNLQRAIDFMESCKVDALVAATAANVMYVTGYYYWADSMLERWMVGPGDTAEPTGARATLFRDGTLDLVVAAILAINARGIENVRIYTFGDLPGTKTEDGQPTQVDALAHSLINRGLTRSRIGIDMDGMALSEIAALRLQLPHANFLDCSNLWRLTRSVKTETEIALLRRAAEISENAALNAMNRAAVGVALADIVASYRRQLAGNDADFDHFIVGLGAVGIVSEPTYELRKGEVVFVDYGCRYAHLFSDTGLTLSLQRDPIAVRLHGALRGAIDAGLSSLIPGRRSSLAFVKMSEELLRSGLRAAQAQGHGIGTQLRDYPIVGPDNGARITDGCVDVASDLAFESGMVVNLEISLFDAHRSFQIEQSFVIRPAGAEPLTMQHRESPFIPRPAN